MAQMSQPMRILVDRRPTNLQVTEKGEEEYCCDLVMCIEESSGYILSSEVVKPDDGNGAVVVCAQKALEAVRQDAPGRRVAWVVRQESVAAALAVATRGPSIELAPADTFDLWDEAYLSMDSEMGSGGAMLPYLWRGENTPEEVAQLFKAAAVCYRLKPWRFLTDADVLDIPSPVAGEPPLIVSVMGAGGIAQGLALFDSEADLHRMMGDDEERANLVYASFERRDRVPYTVTSEAEQHGWVTAAKSAFPTVVRVRKGRPVPSRGDDLRRVTAAFQALSDLAREYSKSGEDFVTE